MFAISLTLVVLISTAVLLYQYWSGALAPADRDGRLSEFPDAREEQSTPAQAA